MSHQQLWTIKEECGEKYWFGDKHYIIEMDDTIEKIICESKEIAERIITCHNACAGINPKAVRMMVSLIARIIHFEKYPDEIVEFAKEAQRALAKAKETE